jgi:uncharacterized membrane protein (UPF0136 family)
LWDLAGHGLAFNASLVLLGIGVGAVIPTVSSRAIEVAGIERASLVSGIVFMCQLSGAAVLLAVNTAIFSAASAWHWERSSAAEGIVLAPDQRQAVQEVMAGARNIHAVPLRTVAEVDHLAEIIEQAYQYGLRLAMWFSAALVVAVLILVLRSVRSGPDRPGASQGRGGEARHL